MAKYFIGSVGTAEAFRMDGSELKLAFVSKTLTDSGLNISTTKDDLRAGTGAPIVASFYHDPSVEITLTDVMFKTAYVEAQLGADFVANGEAYQSENVVTGAAGAVSLAKMPAALNLGCGNSAKVIVWYSEQGKDDWKIIEQASASQSITLGSEAGKKFCVRYLALDEAARVATITSNMIPQELYLIITAPIFAGDACSASNGKQAGTIQFEVPRFKLNGAQDFAMAMSANQTLSLAGTALASDDGCELNGSKLLRIIEVIWNRKWYEGVESLEFDPDYLHIGDVPEVYAVYSNGSVAKIDNSVFTFSPALVSDAISGTAGSTITATFAGVSPSLVATGTIEA